ncbi:2-phospho-L-lactate guanylyltransferase [Nocardiopsis baichengensis]|uniref:2-phospho-L-lactate guanylyltransferase n=1 Tax=Nocardiopsis baichengensis TaxID=280240 RepID=UPI000349DC23|nr:2-phospho-L-lactate guanylyltransferase [Nocardiopsis baichengensis]
MTLLWSVLVPVKALEDAKTRLAGPDDAAARAELALAFACDTVMAAAACSRVGRVFAVTDDTRAHEALGALGAHIVDGEPGGGLNPALGHGAERARGALPEAGVCALSADLPALRPDELDRVLADAGLHARSFAADAQGVGTTLYAAAPGSVFLPAFEGRSRLRHRSLGTVEILRTDVPGLRRDVDTREDLAQARALGVGPHTAKVLGRLGL